ncbi:hypothetical protein N665_0911s0024 [Sinapis alba]|nr:hypothetical protein N665_0911s0024 [Sinapis alba]
MEEEKRLELRLAPPCHQLNSTTNTNINGSRQRSLHKETSFVSNNRVEAAPVVGWPPVRSSRRYLTAQLKEETKKIESDEGRELYVKINMEGVPIGRKVNLSAYNNYQQLSHAVDQLFSKKDSSDLNRQYTLVYEDTEGDKVLVGDVPWEMFVSTVKRLHVLKTSHVSMLSPRKHTKE